MTSPPDAVRDPRRLQALRDSGLLDTPPEEPFDRLTRMATRLLNAPVALVSLVDEDRQFFKSCIGLPQPWAAERQTPLSHSFCQYCVAAGEPLIVEDARRHELVRENLAISDLGVIAYAGVPLITSDGARLGSFCVIDSRPRQWTDVEVELLKDLAEVAVSEIELRALAATARTAQRKAEDAMRDKRQLMATVGHELRQPLGAMTAALSVLRQPAPSVRERALKVLERQIAQLNRLVEDLLEVSRVEGQRFSLVRKRVDLRELVGDTVETLRPVVTQEGRTLDLHLGDRPLVAEVDGSRIVQVLTNLLHNASKFTPAGEVIAVHVEHEAAHGVVVVRDTGRGMDRELLGRLFEPFMQGQRGERGGLGLGLAVARGLVEAHGGTIEAHSEGPGTGSAFTVRLPLAE